MELKTNYVDDVLDTSRNVSRKYRETRNDDGTISLEDVTVYSQEGSPFSANDINATNGKVNEIDSNLTTQDGEQFRYARVNGKRGYIVNESGADTFFPFSKSPFQIKVNYRLNIHNHGWRNQTAIYTRQEDDSYKLTSGGSLSDNCTHVWESYHRETFYATTEIIGIEFVYD